MYSLLIAPFAALLAAQAVKNVVDAFSGKFSWSDLNRYGGMPSAHSALVGALATEMATAYGIWSAPFALAAGFGFLTLRDAAGMRRMLGTHAKILNRLIKELPDSVEASFPHLEERLGHTYGQVLIGALIGVIVALAI